MNIYVGNISFQLEESGLEAAFGEFGTVDSARIITDRATGRSKGFGFVEMPNESQAKVAMAKLHETRVAKNRIRVKIAQ